MYYWERVLPKGTVKTAKRTNTFFFSYEAANGEIVKGKFSIADAIASAKGKDWNEKYQVRAELLKAGEAYLRKFANEHVAKYAFIGVIGDKIKANAISVLKEAEFLYGVGGLVSSFKDYANCAIFEA